MTTNPPRVLVPIADGSEEMEFTIVVDVLRRGGVEVVTAGLASPGLAVECSRGVRIVPDRALAEVVGPFDAVVLVGGLGGADAFAASEMLRGAVVAHRAAGRLTAAVCAAPRVLLAYGLGAGSRMTSHPSVRTAFDGVSEWVDAPVVEDGMLVTSQGPGTSFAFALTLLRRLRGADVAQQVESGLMLTGPVIGPG
ncbi:MAG: DJ-1/PfpI family protein [Planctomycetota bacterium]|nr:DJ-1/PfpI family protein [Planctomycetota bacterium]MDA0932413.1 DJ-1/PfpI family protein [Planctomycetota bacterium]